MKQEVEDGWTEYEFVSRKSGRAVLHYSGRDPVHALTEFRLDCRGGAEPSARAWAERMLTRRVRVA